MTTVGKPLIQVGSNIFELIEFTVTKPIENNNSTHVSPTLYGVNVAKVREVIRLPKIVPCLTSASEVLGVFNLRGLPIPVINLAKALGYADEPVSPTSQVIVTEFSGRLAGFVVSGTRRIRRVSWDKVLPPSSDAFNSITGMMLIENQDFIFILDFERILIDIERRSGGEQSGSSSYHVNESTQTQRGGAKPLVLVVDDSSTARKAISEMLRGFNLEVMEFSNGDEAWNEINSSVEGGLTSKIQLIVSDVEMPKLDGYSLVRRIRKSARLNHLPIILHSSLTGEVNRERAKQAGANAYVSKLNKKEMVEALNAVFPGYIAGSA
ncbi:MAG: chemotaxis protein [Bdellovibrionota bacterium]